jgi:ParB family chromosome partitioning protein
MGTTGWGGVMSKKEYAESKNAAFLAGLKARREEGTVRTGDPAEFATAPGRTAERQERQWLEEQLALARKSEIGLELLHEAKSRKRVLTPQQFNELRENIRLHGMISAITVRTQEQGGFEIVSGHNRVAAARELGHKTIKAVVIDSDEAQANLNAFYANLIQPSLPDFEKYEGFKRIEEVTQKPRKEMAKDAGVDPSMVTLWLSFGDLPEEAIALVKSKPGKLGAAAAAALAKLTKAGKGVMVVEAVRLLIEGNISQIDAVRAASKVASKAGSPAPKPVRILSGKRLYAEMRGTAATLRITFTSQEERARVEALIQKLVVEQSKKD